MFSSICACYKSCNSTKCMKTLAKLLVYLSLILAVIAIVGYSYDLYRHGGKRHLIGWFSSGAFVVLTFLISIRLIVMHLINWRQPNIQKYIVRIIWMVPLYSVESWLALRFRSMAIYIETFRECYEAYVIYNFFYYIIALLGDSEVQVIGLLKNKPRERGMHRWPFSMCVSSTATIAGPVVSMAAWTWAWLCSWIPSYAWCSACCQNYFCCRCCSASQSPYPAAIPTPPPLWVPGAELLYKCKTGVFQYVITKNFLALVVFVLETLNLYGEGHFRYDMGYAYICVINFVSQFWALYCLVLFYNALKEELAPFKPFGKFLCVKLIVFFTWWQSILISLAVSYHEMTSGSVGSTGTNVPVGSGPDEGVVTDSTAIEAENPDSWTGEEISKGVQDFLICIEMLLFALAFTATFPYKDFMANSGMSPVSAATAAVSGSVASSSGPSGAGSVASSGSSITHSPVPGRDLHASTVARIPGSSGKFKADDDADYDVDNSNSSSSHGSTEGDLELQRHHRLDATKDSPNNSSAYKINPSGTEPGDSEGERDTSQPFLFAFLQSSIPADLWEDLRMVATTSNTLGSASGSEGSEAGDCEGEEGEGADGNDGDDTGAAEEGNATQPLLKRSNSSAELGGKGSSSSSDAAPSSTIRTAFAALTHSLSQHRTPSVVQKKEGVGATGGLGDDNDFSGLQRMSSGDLASAAERREQRLNPSTESASDATSSLLQKGDAQDV